MVAEETQELGRTGIAIIKRWIEATTFIELPFDAYNHSVNCTARHLNGKDGKPGLKRFDLGGYYLTGRKSPLFIEGKRYSSAGGQYPEFREFLAIAYSATALQIFEHGGSTNEPHFMWVTFHPFNLRRWSNLEHHSELELALKAHPGYLGGKAIDQDLVRAVASRVSVLVFNPKQEELSLTSDELIAVRGVINRKADGL